MAALIPTLDIPALLLQKKLGTPSEAIDKVLQTTGIGTVSNALGNTFYGINHRQKPGSISIKKDYFGLTFFTRPRMNLTTENLQQVRTMLQLLTNKSESIQRIIRCLLDPELAKDGVTSSALVDAQQAFIPVLTNNLISMSGWPDMRAPVHTYQEGLYKESMTIVDGISDIYSTYDITANFRNLPGNPITLMFLYWIRYMSYVFEGRLIPYFEHILFREVDYNTRIYRVTLDDTRQYVKNIAACGAAVPINAPIGAMFDFESDHPINSSGDQVSINFTCTGALYEDDILINEFNRTGVMFNDLMGDKYRESNYTKVPIDALNIFNYRGYPRIDDETRQLEWWVDNNEYKRLLPSVTSYLSNVTGK